MPISGSRIPGRISGDPTKSREAAAAAHNAARDAQQAQRSADVGKIESQASAESGPLLGGDSAERMEDVVGGRVLMIDSDSWIDVAPERLARWLENFATRHGAPVTLTARPHGLHATAADGTVADCHVPFPRTWPQAAEGTDSAATADSADTPDSADGYGLAAAATAHAQADRTVGVLLVRLGGYAMGVFSGGELVSSKVGGRPVASRQSNGGWSQSRYANRRTNQAESHLGAAADTAVRILLPAKLDALIVGGESRAVGKVIGDRRLAKLVELGPEDRVLTVPDPGLDVLKATPVLFNAIRIRILVPEAPPIQ